MFALSHVAESLKLFADALLNIEEQRCIMVKFITMY